MQSTIYLGIHNLFYLFKVASFADWIECYTKNALKSNISHRNVERKCRRQSKPGQFPKKCEHEDLTVDACDSSRQKK